MKRLFALLTVVLLAVVMTVSAYASTEVPVATSIGDVQTPFTSTAPTLDGVLSEGEWTGAKTTITGKNLQVLTALPTVSNLADAGHSLTVDMYTMWDNDYLYFAFVVTDPTYTPTVAGQASGDKMLIYLDPNGLCEAAVLAGKTGAHLANPAVWVEPFVTTAGADYEAVACTFIGANATPSTTWDKTGFDKGGVKKNSDNYCVEVAFPLKALSSATKALSGVETDANFAVGQVCQMGFEYWGEGGSGYRACTTKYDTYVNGGSPIWFGTTNNSINLVLAEEVKVEKPDAPATADTLSIGILAGATALAFAALVIGKKKAN